MTSPSCRKIISVSLFMGNRFKSCVTGAVGSSCLCCFASAEDQILNSPKLEAHFHLTFNKDHITAEKDTGRHRFWSEHSHIWSSHFVTCDMRFGI
jgi:hypothetical protein